LIKRINFTIRQAPRRAQISRVRLDGKRQADGFLLSSWALRLRAIGDDMAARLMPLSFLKQLFIYYNSWPQFSIIFFGAFFDAFCRWRLTRAFF
jgi:hypothetical protein